MDKQLKLIENRLKNYGDLSESYKAANPASLSHNDQSGPPLNNNADLVSMWIARTSNKHLTDASNNDFCTQSEKDDEFFRSLGYQWASMFGGGQAYAEDKKLGAISKIDGAIQELKSNLDGLRWAAQTKIYAEENRFNQSKLDTLKEFHELADKQMQYIDLKFTLKDEMLGLYSAAIVTLTGMVTFIMLTYLKFK